MRLIGQDCAIQITDGGAQDGTPTYGSAVPLKAFARRITEEETGVTSEVSALGDTEEKLRHRRKSTRVEIELLIEATGKLALNIGNYMKVESKVLTSLGAFDTFVGLLTGNSVEIPDGEQIQRLTVSCGAD